MVVGSRLAVTCIGFVLLVALVAMLPLLPVPAAAQDFPGGFLESASSTAVRPTLTASQIQAFLPSRGPFTFPAPYNTQGIRLTNASDCGGSAKDCVNYVGYSYWRRMNNHVGSDIMYIFLGLDRAKGGPGPSLFSYNKVTDEVKNLGPLFDATSSFSWDSGELWYFSATQPTKLYLNDGPRLLRYDVLAKTFEVVLDARTKFGRNRMIWQMHSSNDDQVHSATLRDAKTYDDLGCFAYREDTQQFFYYPKTGDYDECQIDKSGRWLVIKEQIDGRDGEDNVIIDLQTGVQMVLLDRNGAGGHSDNGYGYMVAQDNWNSQPNAFRLWKLDQNPLGPGTLVYHNMDWQVEAPSHLSHANARVDLPPERQYACGSAANRINSNRANEIICFRLDTSLEVLVVAPVLTNLDAPGGGDDYSKAPKGNLDVTGRYFIWTSNLASNRLDAFLVKVPAQLLLSTQPDTTPPSVAITSPRAGAKVGSVVKISIQAADDVGVRNVEVYGDGVLIGKVPCGEAPSCQGSVRWFIHRLASGTHSITAVAVDTSDNSHSATIAVYKRRCICRLGKINASASALSSRTGALPIVVVGGEVYNG